MGWGMSYPGRPADDTLNVLESGVMVPKPLGVANGIATLDGSGVVPSSQLPGSLGGGSVDGAWVTAYDVDFTAAKLENGKRIKPARMTVRHNGVVIHDDVEVPHATTSSPLPEGPEPGPLNLQEHGSEVRFRNIWFLPASE
jgi:hypothetical protein